MRQPESPRVPDQEPEQAKRAKPSVDRKQLDKQKLQRKQQERAEQLEEQQQVASIEQQLASWPDTDAWQQIGESVKSWAEKGLSTAEIVTNATKGNADKWPTVDQWEQIGNSVSSWANEGLSTGEIVERAIGDSSIDNDAFQQFGEAVREWAEQG